MSYPSSTFDAIVDKSLIDTIMCYSDGMEKIEALFRELHRVLKPNGIMVTVSLHKESEVDCFAKTSEGVELFACTTGKIRNKKALDDDRVMVSV